MPNRAFIFKESDSYRAYRIKTFNNPVSYEGQQQTISTMKDCIKYERTLPKLTAWLDKLGFTYPQQLGIRL